ncbi:MAG: hypothetical protein QM783_03405 [Phycisphaerales bacterium]
MDTTQPSQPGSPARRSRLGVLLAINALLACAAGAGLWASYASAQSGGGFANRPHGNYLMVSGRTTGVSGNLVYVVDTVNRELITLRYQRAGGRLETIAYRNLTADSAEGAGGR